MLSSDATLDLSHGIFHLRKAKLEPGGEQPPGHDAATLEDQFGLGVQNPLTAGSDGVL
jgi:hypothetical protein